MGLAITLSLVFLWFVYSTLVIDGNSFKSLGKAFVTLMVSTPERTNVLLV